MAANGLETAQDLANEIHIPLEHAKRLLVTQIATDIDAVTIFRLCDRLRYSGRWLVRAECPPTIRIAATPEDHWWLDSIHALDSHDREILSAALKALLEKSS